MLQFRLRNSLAPQLPNEQTQNLDGTFTQTSTTLDLNTAVSKPKLPGKQPKLVYKLKIFQHDDAGISPFAHRQI